MVEFLRRIFDTSDFPARWHCGNWAPGHGWLHILSDLGVWSAYVAIPLVLGYFLLRRRDLPFRKIFLLFGAFILACGTTHLMEAIIFWWPAYRLAGLIKLFTALISWTTVLALVPTVPRVLEMRSPEELEREIAARMQAERALQQSNSELEQRVHERTAELSKAVSDLRDERELLRITLASIGDGVLVTDALGRITYLNARAESLTQWHTAEATGMPLDKVFRVINETSRLPVEIPATRALHEGVVVSPANHSVLLGKNASETAIDDRAAPIRDAQGNVVGSVLVFRDITERKRHEAAERRHLAELAHAGRLSTVGEMLSGLAHEINQPLAAAANFARAGIRYAKTDPMTTKEQLLNWLEKSATEVERASNIVRRLGAFTRRSGSFGSTFDLNDLVENIVRLSSLLIASTDGGESIPVEFDLARPLPPLFADRVQIEQVLVNLIRNSIEAMENVPAADRRLIVKTERIDEMIRVSVEDNGHGIAEEQKEKLFNPFYTTKSTGMGLGLSISKSIVETHGGKMFVDSVPHQRTSISFQIPLKINPNEATSEAN